MPELGQRHLETPGYVQRRIRPPTLRPADPDKGHLLVGTKGSECRLLGCRDRRENTTG
jgi:hypothetical protein